MSKPLSEQLRELASKATPGPWGHSETDIGTINGWLEPDEYRPIVHCSGTVDDWANNSDLIVALRNALPTIITALQEMEKRDAD